MFRVYKITSQTKLLQVACNVVQCMTVLEDGRFPVHYYALPDLHLYKKMTTLYKKHIKRVKEKK